MDEKEYRELLEHNLAVLTGFGLQYIVAVHGAVTALQQLFSDNTELTDEKVKTLIDIAVRSSKKHKDMLRLSLDERKNYSDSQGSAPLASSSVYGL